MRSSPATAADGTSSTRACHPVAAAEEKSAAIRPSWVTRRTTCGSKDNSSTASEIARATPTEVRPGALLWTARTIGSVPRSSASRRRSASFSSTSSVVGRANT